MDSAPKMALGGISAYVITVGEGVVLRFFFFFFFFFFTKSFSKGSPGAKVTGSKGHRERICRKFSRPSP
jgi:hypothetical protein